MLTARKPRIVVCANSMAALATGDRLTAVLF